MPERLIWSGTVTFGLVAMPVNVVPAAQEGRIAFNLLHERDNARLQRRMVCPADNRTVHIEHIVRGREVEPGRYVVVRDEELESIEPQRSRTIEINTFVDVDSIDPIYYDRPYYLIPSAEGAVKAYRLLVRALDRTNKAGIAEFVMHDREHLVALRAIDDAVCMLTLHYPRDILPAGDIAPSGKGRADRRQTGMIERALKGMMEPFDPERYKDRYREKVARLVAEKEKKKEVVEAPRVAGEPGREEPFDLMMALEESLAKTRDKREHGKSVGGHRGSKGRS